jgi:hypothetical protein
MTDQTVFLRLGPFTAALTTPFADVVAQLKLLYPPQFFPKSADFADFHVALLPGKGLRRVFRPQARFLIDGHAHFKPLPRSQALPLVEWGLNYAIAGLAHQYLIVHAAAIEKNGRDIAGRARRRQKHPHRRSHLSRLAAPVGRARADPALRRPDRPAGAAGQSEE